MTQKVETGAAAEVRGTCLIISSAANLNSSEAGPAGCFLCRFAVLRYVGLTREKVTEACF